MRKSVVVASKIPEKLAKKINQKVDAEGYISISDYIRELLRKDLLG